MKKIILLVAILQSFATLSWGQGFSCTAGEMSLQAYKEHPELLVSKQELEQFTQEYIKQRHLHSGRAIDTHYVVPVVFHILHNGGDEMITDKTVKIEMLHFNEYFNKANPELPTVEPSFGPIVGDAKIEFRLARLDPKGNPTNGIDRIYTRSTYVGSNNTKMRPWPRDKYLNIWAVKGLWDNQSRSSDTSASGVLAFSQYPSSVVNVINGDIVDGIITKWQQIGSNAAFSRPTIAHEAGHWLNLSHVWGDTNNPGVACGDDGVNDTPLTKGHQNTCPSKTAKACTPNILENVQNIMNYAECHVMFTEGQVDRMHAALRSPVSGRSNLWTDSNLMATGVFDTMQPIVSKPIADFTINTHDVCVGNDVVLQNASYNADVTSLNWVLPADASTNNNLSDAVIKVNFFTPGWKTVTLEATNANGTGTATKTLIYVSDLTATPSIVAPFVETFENASSAAMWHPINADNNNTLFSHYTRGGYFSNGSYKLNNYDLHYDGDLDDLVSPSFDLSNLSGTDLNLSFKYSYVVFSQDDYKDSIGTLAVFGSIDCGNTWSRLYYKQGYGLYQGIVPAPYNASPLQEYWSNVSIAIPNSYQNANPKFLIQVRGKKDGNNFYIDNINVGRAAEPNGVRDIATSSIDAMSVVPNPATETTKLLVNLTEPIEANVRIVDMLGHVVSEAYHGSLSQGVHELPLNLGTISSGLYSVILTDGTSSRQVRMVKY
jgi:hypothetical protein